MLRSVSGILGSQFWIVCLTALLLQASAFAVNGQPPFPDPPDDPASQSAPNCPEYPIGNFNGVWFYATSDCMGNMGYGESLTHYEDSQCENGECQNPVDKVGVLATAEAAPVSDNWIVNVQATIDRLQRAIDAPKTSTDRRGRMQHIMTFLNNTLVYLQSGVGPGEKEKAYQQYEAVLVKHESAWRTMKLAGSDLSILLRDKAIEPAMAEMTVAQTEFKAINGNPNVARVKATPGPLLTFVPAAAGGPTFYKCYTVEVERLVGEGTWTTEILQLGIEVRPTAAEARRAVDAVWSERGGFAHRLLGPRGTVWLVVGARNLDP